MRLGEKIRYLREVEGSLRGLDRAMTQQELVRAVREEMDTAVSQSYLSQIESGARPHLTNTTRLLLARFFKVHPGYLVDDPEGYHAELLSEARTLHTRVNEDKLDLWLISGAERFRRDPELRRALLAAAQHDDTRRCLLLLAAILETPSLADGLLEVLRPELAPRHKHSTAKSTQKRSATRNGGRSARAGSVATRDGSLTMKERR
ncbi:MAG: helix-turn-helix domain-containing protein [Acidobacteriaceae bacterium]